MEKEFLEGILLNTGVEIIQNEEIYKKYWVKIQAIFLTEENIKWYEKEYKKDKYNIGKFNPEHCRYWEIFGNASMTEYKIYEKAIDAFEKVQAKECYVIQHPTFWVDKNYIEAYQIEGKYNVSFIKSMEEFEILQEDIIQPFALQYDTIELVAEEIGGWHELYFFDKDLTWIFIYAHDRIKFFYEIKK